MLWKLMRTILDCPHLANFPTPTEPHRTPHVGTLLRSCSCQCMELKYASGPAPDRRSRAATTRTARASRPSTWERVCRRGVRWRVACWHHIARLLTRARGARAARHERGALRAARQEQGTGRGTGAPCSGSADSGPGRLRWTRWLCRYASGEICDGTCYCIVPHSLFSGPSLCVEQIFVDAACADEASELEQMALAEETCDVSSA